MTARHTDFTDGVKAILPIQLGVIPFALIAGVSAVSVDMTAAQGIGMSLIVFAGAAQLVGIQLIGLNAPLFIIWTSTFFINLRFLMYSASLGTHLGKLPLRWKFLLTYLLTDQAYGMSIVDFGEHPEREHKHWFYFGTAVTLWIVWMTCTIIGVFVGALIPESWALNFAVPLTFLALLFATIKDKAMVMAAVAAGITAVVAHSFPYKTGLILAAVVGIAVGMLVENGAKKQKAKG
ncbi:MAG: AzlC family ABC transporter permease [Anaerolineae bacterium]|nr:AzlC family ABC transporter permease [Anaerolineae bacterium]